MPKMISIFDPSANAFREVTEEVARQFVESAKAVEAQLNNGAPVVENIQ